MKEKYILSFLFLAALLAFGQAGCPATFNFGQQSKANVIGLDFAFMQDAPPSRIEPGGEFKIAAKIENYGAIPTTGEFCVEDTVDDRYGGIEKSCQVFSIDAASEDKGKIIPRSEIITIPEGSSFSYNGLDSQPTTISASILYQYSTDFSQVICVKDPGEQTNVACSSSENIQSKVKAPLAITNIEKNLVKVSDGQVRLTVKLTLKKQVNGQLLLPGAVSGFSKESANKVFVSDVSFGSYTLECTGGSNVEILTERVLRCSGIINVDEVIQAQLRVKVDYTVSTVKTHILTIESEQ